MAARAPEERRAIDSLTVPAQMPAPQGKPDFGHAALHPTAGATVVGARKFLVAYNVYLGGAEQLQVAKEVGTAAVLADPPRTPAVDPALTNEKCSFWHFRFDADADMKMGALTDAIAKQPQIKNVYLINQDYSFGQAVAKAAKEYLARKRPDIKIVGEDLHPLAQIKDFAPYITKIKASGAQALITGNWGPDMNLLIMAGIDASTIDVVADGGSKPSHAPDQRQPQPERAVVPGQLGDGLDRVQFRRRIGPARKGDRAEPCLEQDLDPAFIGNPAHSNPENRRDQLNP